MVNIHNVAVNNKLREINWVVDNDAMRVKFCRIGVKSLRMGVVSPPLCFSSNLFQ